MRVGQAAAMTLRTGLCNKLCTSKNTLENSRKKGRQRRVLVPAYYAYRKRYVDYRHAHFNASDQLRDFSPTSHWLRIDVQQFHLLNFPLEVSDRMAGARQSSQCYPGRMALCGGRFLFCYSVIFKSV
jgi:hypothetical protein